MRVGWRCWLVIYAVASIAQVQAAQPMQVLSSIKPVQLIVDALAGDAVASELLLAPQLSPHDFALRFSDLRRMQSAGVVVWLGPQFEHYLAKPLQQLDAVNSVSLLANEAEAAGHSHNPHIWLDPLAVKKSAERITAALVAADAVNSQRYRANLAKFQLELQNLHDHIARQFAPLAGDAVITAHASVLRFLERYNLQHAGSVYAGANELLSLKRIRELRGLVETGTARCIVFEPQLDRSKIHILFEGLELNAVEVDILGAEVASYTNLISIVSDSIFRCLSEKHPGIINDSGIHQGLEHPFTQVLGEFFL